MRRQSLSTPSISRNGIIFGPSLNAWSGAGCVSINNPVRSRGKRTRPTPAQTHVAHSDRSPPAPGNCTECVASKITGNTDLRMIGIERISATRLL